MNKISKKIFSITLASILLVLGTLSWANISYAEPISPDLYTPTNVRVCDLQKTTAKICWDTATKANSEVIYGLSTETIDSPNNKPHIAHGTAFDLTAHSITLSGLKADTKYKYIVRSSPNSSTTSAASSEGTFATKKADGTGGDSGTGVSAPVASTVIAPKISDPFKGKDLLHVGMSVINFLLGLIVMAAIIVIVIAGFRMVTSGGNATTITNAKRAILWAIIGIAVAFLSFAIIQLVHSFLNK